ncbi:MAG: pseudouridine synthase [Nanobdellota archaeon]
MHRVQKLLSERGYCSRRKAEELIDAGRVSVNGTIISLGDKASSQDEIRVDNQPVGSQRKVYLKFHKPIGCVTALRDDFKKTIMDYIDIPERVFPVGRLDYNTSGLLILTNDGDFANRIMHPRYEINKRYEVITDEPLQSADIQQIERGVQLEDSHTSPAQVEILGERKYAITIHEGRNRIIRRILKRCGYSVKSLRRTHIGSISLGGLKQGTFVPLSSQEIKEFCCNDEE